MNILKLLLLVGLCLSGCTPSHQIKFNGIAPSIKNGVFLVKEGNETLYSKSIINGKFNTEGYLDHEGYYFISLMDNDHTAKVLDPHEVYLQPGKYTIKASTNLEKYPHIISESKRQQDLSAYHIILEQSVDIVKDLIQKLEVDLHNPLQTKDEFANNSARLVDAYDRRYRTQLDAFRTFTREHPDSPISAHLMSGLDYEKDPQAYEAIFQKFPPEAKNSEEGKIISDRLSFRLKLQPGDAAPPITGQTPAGKPFNKSTLDKNVYIIDFWKAGNEVSRLNHQDLLKMTQEQLNMTETGVISISLDARRNWWTTAIKEDQLPWTQYSDLKGLDSKNAEDWMITAIPCYYLVDKNWRIVARDISLNRIPFEIKEYLKKLHRDNAVL